MNIDYNKLIFINDIIYMSEEEEKRLKKLAREEIARLECNHKYIITPYDKSMSINITLKQKTYERLYICTPLQYKNESESNKAYISANIMIPEEKELDFIKTLLDGTIKTKNSEKQIPINLEQLKYCIDLLTKYFKFKQNNLTKEDEDKKRICENYIKAVTKVVSKRFGSIRPEDVINKFNQIYAQIQKATNKIKDIDEVKLFYYTINKDKQNQKICSISFNFVCETETITSEALIKKLYKIIKDIRMFCRKIGISTDISIETTDELEILINENDTKTLEDLENCNIVYSEDDEYYDMVEEYLPAKTKKRIK